jgi:plastocyanin
MTLGRFYSIAPVMLALWLTSGTATAEISGKVSLREGDAVAAPAGGDVVVYVDGIQAPVTSPSEPRERTIAMENKMFSPRLQVIPVGEEMSFPNRDAIMHNAFSLSPGNRFDLGLYKSGASKSQPFETPGVVRLYCNIHPQMSAFILVVENPYFARVAADGTYRIPGVPPGIYTVKAWHEKGELEKRVMVGEQGAQDVDFEIDARRFKPKPHLNKFGKPYKRERY